MILICYNHVLNLISGGLLEAPLYPLKPGVSRGRPVFQGGQAPSGPLVIRPLVISIARVQFQWTGRCQCPAVLYMMWRVCDHADVYRLELFIGVANSKPRRISLALATVQTNVWTIYISFATEVGIKPGRNIVCYHTQCNKWFSFRQLIYFQRYWSNYTPQGKHSEKTYKKATFLWFPYHSAASVIAIYRLCGGLSVSKIRYDERV